METAHQSLNEELIEEKLEIAHQSLNEELIEEKLEIAHQSLNEELIEEKLEIAQQSLNEERIEEKLEIAQQSLNEELTEEEFCQQLFVTLFEDPHLLGGLLGEASESAAASSSESSCEEPVKKKAKWASKAALPAFPTQCEPNTRLPINSDVDAFVRDNHFTLNNQILQELIDAVYSPESGINTWNIQQAGGAIFKYQGTYYVHQGMPDQYAVVLQVRIVLNLI